MSVHIPNQLRRDVLQRADGRCEYCRLPGIYRTETLQVDHVRPLRLGGMTVFVNLAIACRRCNEAKGTNIAAFDPSNDSPALLLSPRSDLWTDHFEFRNGALIGRAAAGRATVALLRLNDRDEVVLRSAAARSGFDFG